MLYDKPVTMCGKGGQILQISRSGTDVLTYSHASSTV